MRSGSPDLDDPGRTPPDADPLGFSLFLVSLGVLFLGSLVAYFAVRSRFDVWPPAGTPPLPRLLWVSSTLIVIGGATVQWALVSARANRPGALRRALALTLALGVGFLVTQTLSWVQLLSGHTDVHQHHVFGYLFIFVTGLHALHVVGGLVPLAVVTVNAFRGRYSAVNPSGVRYCAIYWHFLGAVWLVLFGVLVLSG